jgi:hypothetical protein
LKEVRNSSSTFLCDAPAVTPPPRFKVYLLTPKKLLKNALTLPFEFFPEPFLKKPWLSAQILRVSFLAENRRGYQFP